MPEKTSEKTRKSAVHEALVAKREALEARIKFAGTDAIQPHDKDSVKARCEREISEVDAAISKL